MGALEQLTWVSAKKQVRLNPQQHRRNKLAAKMDEQIKMAEAKLNGTTYQPTKRKTVINKETGEMTSLETTKRVKEWWWTNDDGKRLLSIRYGSKVLELGKNKNAVEVADMAALLEALTLIKQAVLSGELDTQMDAASGALRSGFKK
jgi:hypothetical protein